MAHKILLIITFTPSLKWNGRTIRFYQVAKSLSKIGKLDIFSYTSIDKDFFEELCIDVNNLFHLNINNTYYRFKGIFNTVIGRCATKRFSTKASKKSLAHLAKDYDLIFCLWAQSAVDVIEMENTPSIFIDMVDVVSYHYKIAKNINWLRSYFYKQNLSRMIQYEIDVVKKSRLTFLTTFQEKQELISNLSSEDEKIAEKIKILPNYIQKLNSWYYSSESTFNKIAFLGDINYYPNELALDRLINKILPMLTESSPDLILSVIGNISNNKLKQLQHHKNVNFLGYVDNLENALMKIDALIFPLEIVSGIQNKFLTALTYGIPCVATPQYIFHENLSDENQLLIANTDIEFAEKIIRVLQQKDLRERLSLKSREFSQTYLSQEFVEKTFVSDILDNLAF